MESYIDLFKILHKNKKMSKSNKIKEIIVSNLTLLTVVKNVINYKKLKLLMTFLVLFM